MYEDQVHVHAGVSAVRDAPAFGRREGAAGGEVNFAATDPAVNAVQLFARPVASEPGFGRIGFLHS